jgi:hypothetical protein
MAMVKKTERESPEEILEQGNIYFVYRPKVRPEGEDEREHEDIAAEDSARCRTSTSSSSRKAVNSG